MIPQCQVFRTIHIFAGSFFSDDIMFIRTVCFESLDLLKEKLKNAEICFELTKIRTNWVAEIIDSEGNHIELTAPDK